MYESIDIELQIAEYEEQFGMSSDEFLHRWHNGDAPDTFETMDWRILLRHQQDAVGEEVYTQYMHRVAIGSIAYDWEQRLQPVIRTLARIEVWIRNLIGE